MTEDGPDLANYQRRGAEIEILETVKAGHRAYKLRHPLDDGFARGWLSQRQFEAGERFRDIYEGTQHVSGPRYDGIPPPDQQTSRTPPIPVLEAVGEWVLIGKGVGETTVNLLIAFCVMGILRGTTTIERATYRGRVIGALDSLSDHWGN